MSRPILPYSVPNGTEIGTMKTSRRTIILHNSKENPISKIYSFPFTLNQDNQGNYYFDEMQRMIRDIFCTIITGGISPKISSIDVLHNETGKSLDVYVNLENFDCSLETILTRYYGTMDDRNTHVPFLFDISCKKSIMNQFKNFLHELKVKNICHKNITSDNIVCNVTSSKVTQSYRDTRIIYHKIKSIDMRLIDYELSYNPGLINLSDLENDNKRENFDIKIDHSTICELFKKIEQLPDESDIISKSQDDNAKYDDNLQQQFETLSVDSISRTPLFSTGLSSTELSSTPFKVFLGSHDEDPFSFSSGHTVKRLITYLAMANLENAKGNDENDNGSTSTGINSSQNNSDYHNISLNIIVRTLKLDTSENSRLSALYINRSLNKKIIYTIVNYLVILFDVMQQDNPLLY